MFESVKLVFGGFLPRFDPIVLRWLVVYKAGLLAVAVMASAFFPALDTNQYERVIHWPRTGGPTIASFLSAWDGAHYLYLSEVGYRAGSSSCAFYPLWPMLIRVVSEIFGCSHFVTGIALANGFSIAGLLFFYAYVEQEVDTETARSALLLLCAFPTAMFFSFIYTESLFFILCISVFIFLSRGRYLHAGIAAFFMPLTKAVGIFVLFPICVHLLNARAPKQAFLVLYGPIAGYFSYFAFMYAATGNPLEGFEAQRFFPNQPSVARLLDLSGFIAALFRPVRLHGMLDSAIDRALFLAFLFFLPNVWRRSKTLFAYALPVGLVPAMSSLFLSYSRNILMCFPLIVEIAAFLDRKSHPLRFWNVFALCCIIQCWFLFRYLNFIWTA